MQSEPLFRDVAATMSLPNTPVPVTLTLGYAHAISGEPDSLGGAAGGRHAWTHDVLLDIELVITTTGRSFAPPSSLSIDGFVGAVWRVAARKQCPPLMFAASLPKTYSGHPDGGEHLESLDVETADWRMSIGGYDDDVIAALIGTDLPASWTGLMHVQEWGGRFGASFPSPSSLAWVLPGLEPGERFDFHVAVAWVDQQHNTPTNGVAPWYAVDTTPRELLAAAGTL